MQKLVMIIDDNEDDVMLAEVIISEIRSDIILEVAMSGDAGLEMLRGGDVRPSLILLDLKMPRMNGFEVLQNIRADDRLRHIPVVLLTNSQLEDDREASVKAGADGFLQKASSLHQFKVDLELVLKRWLDTTFLSPIKQN